MGSIGGMQECYGDVGMAPYIEDLPTRSLCPHCGCGLKEELGGSPSREW